MVTPLASMQRLAGRALPGAVAVLAFALASLAHAAAPWIAAAIDTDDDPSTGCTISTADGPVAGIELVVTTRMLTSASDARVTRVERQTCEGASLGSPVTHDLSGWPVGLGAGDGGRAVVETWLPRAWLGRASRVRIVVFAGDGEGGVDAAPAFAIALAAEPVAAPRPVPLSPWLALPLALAIGALAWRFARRRPEHARAVAMLVVFAFSGLAWAASVVRDGAIGDWAGVPPAVVDPDGDAPPDADIVAVFAQTDAANLYLRIDADIRKTPASNVAPTVSAGTAQSITLPAAADLSGSANDDGLPNPPAALTLAWSKDSGPGTVVFGNSAQATTTATFSAAGSYVLRLSAFDGALTGSATVAITVSSASGTNAAPQVSAGPGQSITLPAPAALAGSASDDGNPNPPGALTTTWSVEAGAPGPVSFADPAQPSTNATFTAPGSYTLRLTAFDGELTASATTTVTVADGAPTLAAVADRTIGPGERLQVVLEAREGNANDLLTFSLPTAPAGATLNPAPLVDWVPSMAQLGVHPFTARVADSGGKFATTSFNVTVVHVNRAPQLSPQASLSMPVGAPFARTLSATDPDAGDTLTFAKVAGPPGMTLSGADLAWATSGHAPGDYAVTVKVTDAAGLFDQKTFTITLVAAPPPPVANDDSYEVKVSQTLVVPPAGVLGNDVNPGSGALAAAKLTDPDAGAVTAFGSDGGFTFEAPATVPGDPLTMAKLWNTSSAGSDRYHELVADLDGDGKPDIVSFDNNGGIRARSGLDGANLWVGDRGTATDCAINSGSGSMDHRVLADLDDSGHPTLAFTTGCGRDTGGVWHDRIIAFDHLGKMKWVSPPLSKPHPDARRGAEPVPPEGFTVGGIAWRRGLSVARLTADGPPMLLMRVEIPVNDGYTVYRNAAGQGFYSGCRAVTGLPADENVACRATLLISGTDGSVVQALVARNPAATAHVGGPNALLEMPPIAMDIDGDGRVDLVSGTEVWKQNAAGGFDLAWEIDAAVNDTAVADLDGDGKAEIVHIRSTGVADFALRGIFVYGHDGELKRRIPLWTYWFTPLTLADVDGDGRTDIVLGANGTVFAFRDDGRPIWAYNVPPDLPPDPVLAAVYVQPGADQRVTNAAPQVYDLDGDGIAEVVVAAYARILVLDGRTGVPKLDPVWTYNHSYTDVSALILADLNDDGRVDVVQSAPFLFNCLNPAIAPTCAGLVTPLALSGGGANHWLPGPKTFPNVQYRSTAIGDDARVLHDTTVSRIFRVPAQQGTIRDPRLAQATSFTYEASNGAGPSAPATVFVRIVPDNRPPVFTSVPPKSLWQRFAPNPPGGLVTHYYDLAAVDPDPGDTVTFSLKSAPSWVTLSGPDRIRFEPTCGSFGNPCPWGQTTVIVTATDSRGASTDQIFIVNLTTTAATVPDVVGMLLAPAQAALSAAGLQGIVWAEQFDLAPAGTVLAQEAAAGAVVGQYDDVKLTVSKGPQPIPMPFVVGMQLSAANGILASAGLSVDVATVVSTTIPPGEVTAQSPAFGTLLDPATAPPVELTVSAGGPLAAPVASIVIEPGPGPFARLAGEEQQFKATAVLTDGTSADVTLTAVWTSTASAVASVDVAGYVKAKTAGPATIAAAHSGKSASVVVNVSSLVPGDAIGPTAVIASPAEGASVTGPVDVIGTASDANFLRYELAISPATEETFTVIAEGSSPVANGTLGTLDLAVLLNDLYTLRLRVWDRGENLSEASVSVQVAGHRKPGLFTVAYQDLLVPAAGIPVAVNRVYDSRDKAAGDFGVGWRLSYNTLRLRSNRILGTGWVRVVSGPNVSLVALSPHKVSVTLADGRVEEFDMQVSPTSNFGSLDFTAVTGFVPRAGTLGKLEVLGNTSLLIVNGGAEDELVDDYSFDTYDPKLYRYTALDGTVYEIHVKDGVRTITDRIGNRITIGPDGILHSNGASVAITRDATGRILQIVDPAGHAQSYAYDGNGDLVSRVDAVGGESRYRYDRRHNLIDIRDPAGVSVTRNEYDDTGRLVAIVDATGRSMTFVHDEAASTEIVTDRLGRVARLSYDAVGNVTRREQAVTVDGMLVTAVTTASFDGFGNRTEDIDADGMRTTGAFDRTLPLSVVQDAGGLALTTAYAYDTQNRLTSLVDPAGRTVALAYSAGGGVSGVTVPGSGTIAFATDAMGLPVERIDPLGNRLVLTRDAAGNVVREEHFQGSATLLKRIDFTWDANANMTSRTLHRTVDGASVPLATRYEYDAANRLVARIDARGGTSRIEYDANGREVATIDALGRRTTSTYDALGRRTRVTHPDGTFETSAYDAEGNELASTDRAGRTTTHAYDELNRRIATTAPDGATTRIVYSAGGRVVATIDALGGRTDVLHDGAGRVIGRSFPAVADGPGGPLLRPQVAHTLDAIGRRIASTDANGRVTTRQYDAAGNVTRITYDDGTFVTQTFDALGRNTGVTNEEGEATTFTYDAIGRLLAVAGLAGDATFGYDEADNRVRQTDALGRSTSRRFDELDRLVELTRPGGEVWRTAYDAVGNTIARTDASGRVTAFQHDAMNRLVRKSLPGGAVVTYAYAADGNRSAVVDARGTTAYTYDAGGRLATVAHPGGPTVAYDYDAKGLLRSLAAPSGTATYAYDALGRLTGVVSPEGAASFAYDLAGNRVRETVANGVVTDTVYDARSRPTLTTHKAPGGASLQSFAMSYTPSGRRLAMTESGGATESWSYDTRGRLASEARTGSDPFAITHAYDAVGNRVQTVRGGVPTAFAYDANDRLVSAGATTYAWDANGDLASRASGGDVTQFGFDAEHRLVAILGSGASAQYAYDHDGNRVTAVAGGGVTRFLVDRANPTGLSQVIEERDGANGLVARYAYGNEQVAQARAGAPSFPMRDALGSVRALTDGAGAVTGRYVFDGYGTTVADSGATANPYRYRGERQDPESGLYQLRARYYDPSVGRFLSPDPLPGRAEMPATLHRYAYAANDPINFADPTGMEFQLPSLLTTLFIINVTADIVSFTASIYGAQDVAMVAGAISLATALLTIPVQGGKLALKATVGESTKEFAEKLAKDGAARRALQKEFVDDEFKKVVAKEAAKRAGQEVAADALQAVAKQHVDDILQMFGGQTSEILKLAAQRSARTIARDLPNKVSAMRAALKVLVKSKLPWREDLVAKTMLAELEDIMVAVGAL